MGVDDKIDNAAQKLAGKGKEAAGKASGDESLKAEGRGDQAAADIKQAGEKVKDAFKNGAPHRLLPDNFRLGPILAATHAALRE